MSNNKQSSLDYYITKLTEILGSEIIKQISRDDNERIARLEKQSKAMHKEETVDLIVQYEIKHHLIFTEEGILNTVKKAEQYYNETFGGEQ